MRLFRITDPKFHAEFDCFDSAIVCAESCGIAQNMHPRDGRLFSSGDTTWLDEWIHPDDVFVEFLCEVDLPRSVLLTSYQAG